MNRLFQRQLAKATDETGNVDLGVLGDLVESAYQEADRDRQRTDRSISLMIEELEAAHQHLVDAFQVIPEGMALLDADDRYVMWNRPYEEMYADTGNFTPGMSFEEALRAGLSRGQYADAVGREDEWLAQRMARHRQPESSHEQRLSGGRWLRVEERRTANGGSVGVRIDITDLKQREASFRLLFEGNPIPMFVCHASTSELLAVNDSAVTHYGFTRDQLLVMSVRDLCPGEARDKVLQIVETGQICRHIKANGDPIEVEIYSKPLTYSGTPAIFFAAIDVTERLAAERHLRTQKLRTDAAISNMPQGLLMFDADARLILCNERIIEMYGFSREVVKPGCTLQSLLEHGKEKNHLGAEDVEEQGRRLIDAARRGESFVRTNELPDGRIIYASSRPMEGGGWVSTHEDITEQRKAQQQIEYLALHDGLTHLPNRVAFNAFLTEKVASAKANGEKIALVCMDLDRFKDVNDVFGHSVGDGVLCEAATRMREVASGAFLARLGGDEFVAVVHGGAQPAAAEELCSRLMTTVNRPYEVKGHLARCGLSIGVAIYPDDGADATAVLANADAALYRAKRGGRGAVRFFKPEMDQLLRTRRALQHDLQASLVNNELKLHYQPQARIDGVIVGFEALARWMHPKEGFVPPSVFIPLAEESGLIMQLGELALRQACAEAASWPKPLRISVNLSPVQFQHGNLVELVHKVLLDTGLAAERLELEITESVLVDDFDRAIALLRRLKALGVRVAMDDFGTGYSSLSYLHSFPFDRIKIDRSFVGRLGKNYPASAIIKAVIALARGLSLPVTVEGVETEEQLAFLTAEACDEVQGYLIGRPLPIEEFEAITGRSSSKYSLLSRAG